MRSVEFLCDRRMHPFVMAGEVTGIECRAQAALGERALHRLEDRSALDFDINRLVPGDQAGEINRCRREEWFVPIGHLASPAG